MVKKIIKICLLIILGIIIVFVGNIALIVYDTFRTHTLEIELDQISQQEKEKLIELNFLELDEYPSSLEFIKLRHEAEIRESQFYIVFSVNKEDANNSEIENENNSTNGVSILKIKEKNGKIIYEMQTNFTQHSKAEKWDYLYELIGKYKNK